MPILKQIKQKQRKIPFKIFNLSFVFRFHECVCGLLSCRVSGGR